MFIFILIFVFMSSSILIIVLLDSDRLIRFAHYCSIPSGKASEGIDFRNNKGRVVIITGADIVLNTTDSLS
jgi:hypothetical protein